MKRLRRSIATMFLAGFVMGCDGGGASSEPTPQQKDPGAAAAEAKKLMGGGGMAPGPIKKAPAKKS
ncbi:hypothetical protein [Singulisphaera acidiphila]|uniref:Lipoprotein n=1 Tax=Singulisphaera acidiphila (strain ATCC BAA-1392 / DSM 18658 / VKM B-2454 / MOB10) TaxID=886293 RepID=L0DJ36_SINAD|nr:hypothetical protein [Singulisphaera acidiphila]AGA29282.1 hypothetical protein Sinac_5130 [Singulisphaera acidiphila DSM 18658]